MYFLLQASISIALEGRAMLGFAVPERAEALSSKQADPLGLVTHHIGKLGRHHQLLKAGCVMHTVMTDSSWTLLSFSARISAASVLLHAHTCVACMQSA